jgi:aconitate hydratase
VPAVVDLAAMRDAMAELGGDPARINPLVPAELVIDHSVQVADVRRRRRVPAQRRDRVRAQPRALPVPALGPGGVRRASRSCRPTPASSTRSTSSTWPGRVPNEPTGRPGLPRHAGRHRLPHPMVNGLGVLGWGVGGIEAEAAMLGQPVSMLIPQVVGFKLTGELPEGATATDLVLTDHRDAARARRGRQVRRVLRPGVAQRAARPTAPRSATCRPSTARPSAIFPIDEETLATCASPAAPTSRSRWSRPTPRSRACGTTRPTEPATPRHLELDLSTVVPSLAGPKRPQDRVDLSDAKRAFREALLRDYVDRRTGVPSAERRASTRRARDLPGQRPPSRRRGHGNGESAAEATSLRRRRGTGPTVPPGRGDPGRRHELRARPRRGRDRRDHLLHQHLQPVGDDRRRPAGQERRRARARPQAVGQDHAGARLQGRHGLLRPRRPDPLPRQARLQPRRLRLHHLHRQLRAR